MSADPCAELLAALKRARDVIRAFHSIGITSVKEEDQLWARYQHSPEMQAINAAIKKAEESHTRVDMEC